MQRSASPSFQPHDQQEAFSTSNNGQLQQAEASNPSLLGANQEAFKIVFCPGCDERVPEKYFNEHQRKDCKRK